MKWYVILLCAFIAVAIVAASVYFIVEYLRDRNNNFNQPDDNTTGVTKDNSDKNAKKHIDSTELISFSMKISDVSLDCESSVILKDDKAEVSVTYGEDKISFVFTADESVLDRLEKIIRENGLAQFNGHSVRNSAIGSYLDIRADYASGEKITMFGEGGYAVIPYGFSAEPYLEFFAELCREYGHDVHLKYPGITG